MRVLCQRLLVGGVRSVLCDHEHPSVALLDLDVLVDVEFDLVLACVESRATRLGRRSTKLLPRRLHVGQSSKHNRYVLLGAKRAN